MRPDPRDDDWEFWIDVGGTFTDCIGRSPDGAIHVHKLLSSGAYRGRLGPGSTPTVLRVADIAMAPPGFFEGFEATLLGRDRPANRPLVKEFDPLAGVLILDRELPRLPRPGDSYELTSSELAPILGIYWLLGKRPGEPIGAVRVRLGTTRGTNALLERRGARTALVTTRGFGDVLRIAYQNRPKLFDLCIRKPSQLYQAVVELEERIDAAGAILVPLDPDRVRAALADLLEQKIESLAVVLLNSYLEGSHEEIVGQVARQLGFAHVSLSSRVAPSQRLVDRGDTTVVDAYLTPILRDYVGRIGARLPRARIDLMTSSGSLVSARAFVGKDSILSGPAGGVVGVALAARAAGYSQAIGFDMGGTSTDVCRYAGAFERRYVMEVSDPNSGTGVRIVAPMLAVETVAAGGGSICSFDGTRALVGPASSGSEPGPACYGKGGPLCVTDLNLHLGRLLPEHFAFPLDREATLSRLDEIADQMAAATGHRPGRDELAVGFLRIANANMAAAVKKVSLARGHDVRDDLLVSFGGAGGQHACAIARELGITKILQHPHAGVLSALGIGMADTTRFRQWHVGRELTQSAIDDLKPRFRALEEQMRAELLDEGVPAERILAPRRLLDLRYQGQESTITIPRPEDGDDRALFERRHFEQFGFTFPGRPVEIHAARLEMTGARAPLDPPVCPMTTRSPEPSEWTKGYWDGVWHDTKVFVRALLGSGDVIDGPALIAEETSTIVVEPGWRAEVTATGDVLLFDTRGRGPAAREADASLADADPILLELYHKRFGSIAEQMGVTLARTALSTNVKERLDFSCALFTARGDLVVNAPHIPVHLGAMSETVRRLIQEEPAPRPGDVFITNDPFQGGSHLPDVTVMTPVFGPDGAVMAYVGSRAHHAEIGGIVPGSMPPFSRSLAEEGVLLRRFRLVEGERASEDLLRQKLLSAPYPTRAIEENLADIRAQVAANRTGASRLTEMAARMGLEAVRAYMDHLQRAAERKMRAALARLPARTYRFADRLDNGRAIAVAITIRHTEAGGEADIDFAGTGPVCADNQNANPAIVRSAVLYVCRCLLEEDVPLNDGVLAPVRIRIPAGCLLDPPSDPDPARCPAVGGGNVETSQRVVDVLLGALGVVAASQGTMNNLLFGRPATSGQSGFGYYETIGGGAGGGPGFAGASAVHTHMTNTRITDVEVLEARYPVRALEFSIRRHSGGAGLFPGGDGIVRVMEFLTEVEVSLLSNRRTTAPYGLAGGSPGSPGRNLLLRASGMPAIDLGPAAQFTARPGDCLRIETPGGGGFGAPPNPR